MRALIRTEIADKCAWHTVGSIGGMADLGLASGTFAKQGNWDDDSANGTLLNPISGFCATDPNGSLTQSTQLQLAACTAGSGQVWSTPPTPRYATITWNETATVGAGQSVYLVGSVRPSGRGTPVKKEPGGGTIKPPPGPE